MNFTDLLLKSVVSSIMWLLIIGLLALLMGIPRRRCSLQLKAITSKASTLHQKAQILLFRSALPFNGLPVHKGSILWSR